MRSVAALRILLLVSLIFLVGCDVGGMAGRTPTPKAAVPEIKTLALGFGLDPPFAPHIVAIKKGWFEEAGFEKVETKTFTAGALAGEALAAGEIHLWVPGNLPPISMRHAGKPIVVVGTDCLAYLEKLVVRTDAGVENPEDLYKIKLAVLAGTTATAYLDKLATHYNLDATKLKVVSLAPADALTALVNNEVQGFIMWNPWPYLALQKTKAKILHTGTVSYFAKDYGARVRVSDTRSLFVMSEDFIRKSPNAAKAIMKIMLRAQAYVADPVHRSEVIQMFSEYTNSPLEQNEAIWDEYVFNPVFDQTYVNDMQSYTNFLVKSGVIKSPQDVLDYTYTGYVQEFRPEAVIVQGKWKP